MFYFDKYKKYKIKNTLYGSGITNIKQILNSLRILCCVDNIDKGSNGSVYRGIDQMTGKMIIIKKIEFKKNSLSKYSNDIDTLKSNNSLLLSQSNDQLEKCLQEIDIMQSLQHNNIIKCLGYEESLEDITKKKDIIYNKVDDMNSYNSNSYSSTISDDDSYIQKKTNYFYIFIEDVCGKSLHTLITTFYGIPLNIIKIYTLQILNALHYIHSNHILHMDIKSNNILVSNTGTIKIIDFGESYKINPENTTFKLLCRGTPTHMAPEILINLIQDDTPNIEIEHLGKNDIWSFGIMLLHLIIGKIIYPSDFDGSFNGIRFQISKGQLVCQNIVKILFNNLYNKLVIPIDIAKLEIYELYETSYIINEIYKKYEEYKLILNVIQNCLIYNYKQRKSAHELLQFTFFN